MHISNTTLDLFSSKSRFSPVERLRGSIWRGRDCSDFDEKYRPGRRPLNNDVFGDSNCNGIFGVNDTSGNSLEDELCGGSDAKAQYIYLDSNLLAPVDYIIDPV